MVRENNDPCIGIGGAPTRCSTLPTEAAERKKYPIATGCFDYFPDALAAIANVSWAGNEQHNPGEPLHWARGKSTDEPDTMLRHFSQRGTLDTDGKRHTAKAAWRMLAILQKEIEEDQKAVTAVPGGSTTSTTYKSPVQDSGHYRDRFAAAQEIRDDHDQPHFVSTRKMGIYD